MIKGLISWVDSYLKFKVAYLCLLGEKLHLWSAWRKSLYDGSNLAWSAKTSPFSSPHYLYYRHSRSCDRCHWSRHNKPRCAKCRSDHRRKQLYNQHFGLSHNHLVVCRSFHNWQCCEKAKFRKNFKSHRRASLNNNLPCGINFKTLLI